MEKKFKSFSPQKTRKIGADLAKIVQKTAPKGKAIVIALVGELGSGKTTFLQGFAKGIGVKEKVLSPTFIIFRKNKINDSQFQYFYHFDCYRLRKVNELYELGWESIEKNPRNIIVMEWADKVRELAPREDLRLKFVSRDKKEREVSIKKIRPGIFRSFGRHVLA